jgi:hypothetical protein
MSGSNLKIFLFAALLLQLLYSCSDEKNDVIPDITIDFRIYFSDPEFFDLNNAPGSSALISSSHIHLGIGTGGYDNNGIIVYNSGLEGFEYYAFDRTCPHCYVTASESIAVNVDGVFAVCPRCNTLYAMGSSGMPQSGPGQYYLKNYNTDYFGSGVRVWNKRD